MSISSSFGAGGSIAGCAGALVEEVDYDGPAVKELTHISFVIAIISTIIISIRFMWSSMAGFGSGGIGGGGDGDV
ncbi:UNVERIFIED_CONTAM: hypothetical protein Slati_3706500 [Sesamum latifolium]|uniref:Uncharacterized protein n=1 Tax=Sesamum latifolium TaxID=2727402 RepID=A0AAW2U3P0_9LAMI